jgi:hypothetical protein
VGAALLLTVQVVRNAIVAQYAEVLPQVAASAWPSHAAAQLWQGMTQIGHAAGRRQKVAPATLELIRSAARKSPLAAEPFLVRGVEAQLARDPALAERAFFAAKLRDGRSIPARYFLAEHYFRNGDAPRGLNEIAILARMIPDGVTNLAPYVAAYARDRRNHRQLQLLFRSDPVLEDATLSKLAEDPANAETVLRLASRTRAAPAWANVLLQKLVAAGQYDKARAVWMRLAQVPAAGASQLVFDADFNNSDAPPPFNWELTSSTVGLAERQSGGRVHVIFYGHEDGILARQLLVLGPGRYRLAMHVAGGSAKAGALAWSVTCVGAKEPRVSLSLGDSRRAEQGVLFDVPAGCRAQNLQLAGSSQDLPEQIELTVAAFRLTRVQSGG